MIFAQVLSSGTQLVIPMQWESEEAVRKENFLKFNACVNGNGNDADDDDGLSTTLQPN